MRILLEPHLRYTLRANRAAYQYCVDRSKLYDEIYSGSLEEFRALAVQGYLERPFPNLRFEDDLAKRGVADTPRVYPYRDDLRLWRDPIREFVEQYLGSCYASDESVRGDGSLQGWIAELMDGERGRICRLLPGDRLDSRAELIQLLTQVLFTAGPSHASQHFSACVLYRHAPTFAAGVYAPPPGPEERLDFPRWLSMLPPIEAASDQLRSNTFTNFQYDRFGHYGRYRLGRLPEARQAVRRLQEELTRIERIIEARQEGRLFRYEFVLPSRVPNSVNI